MSQNIFANINPATTSGTQLSTLLNEFKDAVASGFIGATRPANLQAGGYWIDNALEASPDFKWIYKVWNGTSDITVFTLNISTNTVAITGSDNSFEVTRISADAVGPLAKLVKRRIASNGQVIDGDVVGELQFVGRGSDSSNPVVCRIKSVASDNMTGSAAGAYLVFEVVTDGTTTLAEAMRLVDGKLAIGSPTADTSLHVKGTGITSERSADDGVGAKLLLKKSRILSSGQVQNGDVISAIESYSKDVAGTSFVATKEEVTASENHTATNRGIAKKIYVTKSGTNTLVEAASFGDTIDLKLQSTIEGYKLNSQDVATAATIAALSSSKSIVNFTGSTATNVQGISASGTTSVILLHNGSSAAITVKHEDAGASATDRIKLPNSRDIIISPDSSLELFRHVGDSRWKLKSGSGGGGGTLAAGGTAGSPLNVSAGTAISVSAVDTRQIRYIQGNAGAVTMTANPAIAAGTDVNTELILVFKSDSNTVTIPEGLGVALKGEFVGYNNSVLKLFWDGSQWVEISRAI